MAAPKLSVVITAYNEGDELRRTVKSIVANTDNLEEVIVVDDGSSDDSCQALQGKDVRLIRHDYRVGVAFSRNEASQLARGDVLCYLDGHQRVRARCLNHLACVAISEQAITCPDVRDYGFFAWRLYGANFGLCSEHGFFRARWRTWRWLRRVSAVTGLCAPPYLIPLALYAKVSWSSSLRGWGASEASVGVKSFFTGTRILHVAGPLARHRFQKRFSYETTWDGIWRNQAIIARICFDDATWFHHWLPHVFEPHLTLEARQTLESPEVQAEHADFLAKKVRTDRQFWTDLLRTPPPAGV